MGRGSNLSHPQAALRLGARRRPTAAQAAAAAAHTAPLAPASTDWLDGPRGLRASVNIAHEDGQLLAFVAMVDPSGDPPRMRKRLYEGQIAAEAVIEANKAIAFLERQGFQARRQQSTTRPFTVPGLARALRARQPAAR